MNGFIMLVTILIDPEIFHYNETLTHESRNFSVTATFSLMYIMTQLFVVK